MQLEDAKWARCAKMLNGTKNSLFAKLLSCEWLNVICRGAKRGERGGRGGGDPSGKYTIEANILSRSFKLRDKHNENEKFSSNFVMINAFR